MIVVEVKLVSAITGKVSTLAKVAICNQGGGTEFKADYRCVSYRKPIDDNHPVVIQREAFVKNHARKAKHVLNLVYKALVAMGYGK